MPVSAGLMAKPAPMSLNRAMGMNSVVLKMKAAQARANTLSQRADSWFFMAADAVWFDCVRCCLDSLCLCMQRGRLKSAKRRHSGAVVRFGSAAVRPRCFGGSQTDFQTAFFVMRRPSEKRETAFQTASGAFLRGFHPENQAKGCCSRMVCSRSGPVEMMATGAPHTSSMRFK